MNDPEPLIMEMAPCNQELKRRYAPLNGASETEGRLNLRQGGFPRRERPWGAVIGKRAAPEPSCPPAAQAIPESPEGLSSSSPLHGRCGITKSACVRELKNCKDTEKDPFGSFSPPLYPRSGVSVKTISFRSHESISKTMISFSPSRSIGAGQYRVFCGPASL